MSESTSKAPSNQNQSARLGPSSVVRRIFAQGIYKLESSAHFGSGEQGEQDLTVLRGADDSLLIPGSSLAGVSRSYLAYRLLGKSGFRYLDPTLERLESRKEIASEEKNLRKKEIEEGLGFLFGGVFGVGDQATGSNNNADNDQSALTCYDAYLISEAEAKPAAQNISIRDGVAIDSKTGQALRNAKYDYEVIENGARFEVRLELIIRQKLARNSEQLNKVMSLFQILLEGFENGDIALGAKTRRGLGRGKIEGGWKVQDFNFAEPGHGLLNVRRWLQKESPAPSDTLANLKESIPELKVDKRRFFDLQATFNLTGSLLVRSYSEVEGQPDSVQLLSGTTPLVPGTSIGGVIRHRAERIVKTLAKDEEKALKWLGILFGDKISQSIDKKSQSSAGRIYIEESLIENPTPPEIQTRIRIDRFTGGVLSGYLFDEKPTWGNRAQPAKLKICCKILEPTKAEIGLLLFVLKDLWLGDLTLGGGSAIGRGVLNGEEACLIWKSETDSDNLTYWYLKNDPENQGELIFTDFGETQLQNLKSKNIARGDFKTLNSFSTHFTQESWQNG